MYYVVGVLKLKKFPMFKHNSNERIALHIIHVIYYLIVSGCVHV